MGADPASVAVAPDGRTAFVACYRGASISVVDLATRTLLHELPVGPGCIDVATDGRRVYSVSDQAAALSVFELGPMPPAAIPAPTPPRPVGESSPVDVSPLVDDEN